jgi:glycosyltransferase involved in cell wall biosynthesis
MPARPLRILWKQVDWPPIEAFTGPLDVVHGPNFVVPPSRGAARIVTVHDLTCIRFPELCTRDTLQYPTLLARALRAGAWVHTVSEFVGREVIELLGADPSRVAVIPNGYVAPVPRAPAMTEPGSTSRAVQLTGGNPYVLALSTVEPRKDLPTLVRAFEQLAAERHDLHLVIAGPDGWGRAALEETIDRCPAPVRRRIIRLGWLDEDDRYNLLASAEALAYPSIYEGFGLPPLEAMAVGTPVVTTTAGALPETTGGAALLVEPGRPEALADALARVLDDSALRTELTTRGRQNVTRYSWDTTAKRLVDLYRLAAGSG